MTLATGALNTMEVFASKEEKAQLETLRTKFGDDAALAITKSPNVEKVLTDINKMPPSAARDQAGNQLADLLRDHPERVSQLNANLTPGNIAAIEKAAQGDTPALTKALPALVSAKDPSQFAAALPATPAPGPTSSVATNAPPKETPAPVHRHLHHNPASAEPEVAGGDEPAEPSTPSSSTATPGQPSVVPVSATVPAAAAAPAAPSAAAQAALVTFLSDPANADIAATFGKLDDAKKEALKTNLGAAMEQDPDLPQHIGDIKKAHPEFFQHVLDDLSKPDQDEAHFSSTLSKDMGQLKTVATMDGAINALVSLVGGPQSGFGKFLGNMLGGLESMLMKSDMGMALGGKLLDEFNPASGGNGPSADHPAGPSGDVKGVSNSNFAMARSSLQAGDTMTVNGNTNTITITAGTSAPGVQQKVPAPA